MSRARDIVQIGVLKTNPVFPFSYLNRVPYRLALNRLERLCDDFAEVRGAYLRHGLTEHGWVPGISDIDLTLTYARGLKPDDEFRFLHRFSARLIALRRVFPMLADVETLDEDILPSLTRFGIRSLDAEYWKVLRGKAPVVERSAAISKDRIDDAMCRFFEYLLPWYSQPASFIRRQRMQRAASRILRYATGSGRESIAADDLTLLITRVLLALDNWILSEESEEETGKDDEKESVLTWEDCYLVVLGTRQDEESVRRSIARHRGRTEGKQLRIVTRRVLRYWLRVWQPRQYFDWKDYAEKVNGPDALSQMAPPGEAAYIRGLLNMTSLILSFPQREEVVVQDRREWFAGEAFRWMAIRGWYLRLYLETGFHSPVHGDVMLQIGLRYPTAARELEDIATSAAAGDCTADALCFRGFCLLKENAAAVHRALPIAPHATVSSSRVLRAAAHGAGA